MSILDFLNEAQTTVTLQATDKQAVIAELMDVLATSDKVQDRDAVLEAILEREQTMSTGVGSGVAVPHGKSPGVTGLVAALGISRAGLPFDAIDNEPVHIIVLLAASPGPAGPHIQALSRVSRVLNQPEARKALLEADTPADAIGVFLEIEKSLPIT